MRGRNPLQIVYLNTNGRPTNNIRLREFIARISNSATILIFNDVRSQTSGDIFIEGFSTIIANNPDNLHHAGGSAILYNNQWTSLEFSSKAEEGIILKIDIPGNTSIIVATLYVHPGKCFPKDFFDDVDEAAKSFPTLLIGDFNSASTEFGSRRNTAEGNHLINLISTSNLAYLDNDTPTYVCSSSGSWNILDLALINAAFFDSIESFEVNEHPVSDHFPIIIELKSSINKTKKIEDKINWDLFAKGCGSSGNFDELLEDLESEEKRLIDGGVVDEARLEEMAVRLTEELKACKSKATTRELRKERKELFPIAPDTRELIKKKRNLNKIYLKNKNRREGEEIKNEYKRINKEMRSLLERDKKLYHSQRINNIEREKNLSKKWRLINDEIGNNKKRSNAPINHLIKPDNTMTKDLDEIVNTHIQRLADTHRPKPPETRQLSWNEELEKDLELHRESFVPLQHLVEEDGDERIRNHFTLAALKDEIGKLKKRSAPGEDGLTNELIQKIPEKIVNILLKLFNILMSTGHFPRVWKRARIRMLPKPKRDKKLSKNYRPISLLSSLGKILEKLVKRALDEEVTIKELIPDAHSGFRKGRGAQENFIRLAESAALAMKTNQVLVAVFIDLDKAFDALHHDSIRVKFKRLGISPKLIRIISSFLRNRKIFVAEGTSISNEEEMEGGSPQGAISSPPIFGIFDADVPIENALDFKEGGTVYADDNLLWAMAPTPFEAITLIQRRLARIEIWSERWRMSPSPDKSNAICFSRRKETRELAKNFSIFLTGKRLPWVSKTTFLGLTIDEKLSFDAHIEDLITRNRQKTLMIRKLTLFNNINDTDLIMRLIDSFITSTFDYSSPAYLGMSAKNWSKIDNFYSRLLKTIFGVPSYASNQMVLDFYLGKKASTIITDRCIKRMKNIIDSSPIVADILPRFSGIDLSRNYHGPIGNILNKCGFVAENCVFCSVGAVHSCVRNI